MCTCRNNEYLHKIKITNTEVFPLKVTKTILLPVNLPAKYSVDSCLRIRSFPTLYIHSFCTIMLVESPVKYFVLKAYEKKIITFCTRLNGF